MRLNGDQSATRPTSQRLGERYTVQEAAHLLGTTVDGIRSRIKRGTLDSMKVGGQVFVLLGPDQTGLGEASHDQPRPDPPSHDSQALLAAKDETISHLCRELDARNEELRRKDHIIMQMAQRIPELPAPSHEERPGGRESPPDASEYASPRPAPVEAQEGTQEHSNMLKRSNEEAVRRPWWRRLFDG